MLVASISNPSGIAFLSINLKTRRVAPAERLQFSEFWMSAKTMNSRTSLKLTTTGPNRIMFSLNQCPSLPIGFLDSQSNLRPLKTAANPAATNHESQHDQSATAQAARFGHRNWCKHQALNYVSINIESAKFHRCCVEEVGFPIQETIFVQDCSKTGVE